MAYRAGWGCSHPSETKASGHCRAALWDDFCEQLKMVVRAELGEVRESLLSSYQPFDPARRRWIGKWPLPDKEAKFAREFLRTAALAGFKPVSRKDLERTRELKA